MSSQEFADFGKQPRVEAEAWRYLTNVIEYLDGEEGADQAMLSQQLERIVRRLEIYRYERSDSSLRTESSLFVPANNQRESIRVRTWNYNDSHNLTWRVVRELEDETIFWECCLSRAENDEPIVQLRQSKLLDDQITDGLADKYLLHSDSRDSGIGSRVTGVYFNGSGSQIGMAEVGHDYSGEFIGVPFNDVQAIKRCFIQPE